jgi:dipeptidyl aminopeptidase/acylaminoacyl peptidase
MVSRAARMFATYLAILLSTLIWAVASQKTSVDAVLDSLAAVHSFREVAISPDGQRVAWVETLPEANGAPSGNFAIFVANLSSSGSPPRRITAGSGSACEEHGIAWSPDSRELAFLSNAQSPDQLQLYVASVTGGSARKLTSLTGSMDEPSWSPDGKTLALLFTENAPRAPGPLGPMTPPSGVIGRKVYEQRLTTVDVATGRIRQLSPPGLYVYEYDWSPEGKQFVATAAHGAGDDNWYVAEIYTIDVVSGETKSLYKPAFQIGGPRWSPDGKSIAFIGGLMSDEGSIGGDVFLFPATGGEARNLTPGLNASASWLAWQPGGNEILILESLDGGSGIVMLGVQSGRITPLWTGSETLSLGWWNFALSLARDGNICAMLRESFSEPPEIWAGPIGAWRQVTTLNREAHASWGKVESLHWSNDGFQIQGWLTYPRDYDPARRYPLVVEVHGGPGAMARPTWPSTLFDFTILSHEGYFVLRPNPRGSFGHGEAFTRANRMDFGHGDLRDILAGVDFVVKNFPVDNERVGIGGWSYGGFMTMWAVTQTHRFHAAVAGAGIANWQSYYGENDLDQWMIPFFGASVYDDPAVYAKSSPINFIKNVKTPTLILVGDRDGECPMPQSFEFWHALETLGIGNEFVVYPNEGHLIFDPEHRRDIMRRTVEWYDRHLK